MKHTIREKLEHLASRLEELDLELSSSHTDASTYSTLGKERSEIEPLVLLFQQYQQLEKDKTFAQQMLFDAEMKAFAHDELEQIKHKQDALEQQLQKALLPKDPNDHRNIFLEIRAGTGGDEAALFSADLMRMYSRYAMQQQWKIEIISENASDLGGYKEVILKVLGKDVYSKLKFESGAHRVQRVPVTETQGRVHTSACTVAVLPEADELEVVNINPADLRIDTFRASGAGGQHINKTDSAVRITHIPTGLVVECQDDRSQHRNKAQAMSVLGARLYDMQLRERQSKEASARKSLVGSGDRSERIRTYNFPQGRVTDHRINMTLYKLESFMQGEMDELLSALIVENQANLMAELSSD